MGKACIRLRERFLLQEAPGERLQEESQEEIEGRRRMHNPTTACKAHPQQLHRAAPDSRANRKLIRSD